MNYNLRSLIRIAGGASVGKSHLKQGIPCQDKYYIWKGRDKKSAGIALADGAGSSEFSQIGAELTVNGVIKYVKDNYLIIQSDLNNSKKLIIDELLIALKNTADGLGINVSELACTLLFIVIQRNRDKINYIAGHIGDGVIVVGKNDNIYVLSHPHRGEYANTTYFVTTKCSENAFRMYTGVIDAPVGFMLMSDGAAETLYIKNKKDINKKLCQQIFKWSTKYSNNKVCKIINKNLKSGIFSEETSDDCSLVTLCVT